MKDYYKYYDKTAELFPFSITTPESIENEKMLRWELCNIAFSSDPILDIGSGTGRTVIAIAESIPDADILAVEPSDAMRAVLTHQVVHREDLRKRVTIISEPVSNIDLPEKLGAVVAYGVIGHLDLTARKKLWKKLIPRLPKGAPIFVELMPMDKPMNFPVMPTMKVEIGRCLYEGTVSGEIIEGDLMRITSRWTISGCISPKKVIETHNFWHTFGMDDLSSETGLSAKKLNRATGVLFA
jgi:SAM-dependent methyltransferase